MDDQQPYWQPDQQPGWDQQPYPQPAQPYGYLPQPYGQQPGEPPLDQPWYGIGFLAATKRAFQKYATFDGRASRGEYWWFVLASNAVLLVFALLLGLTLALGAYRGGDADSPGPLVVALGMLAFLFLLGIVVPSISITVRRLHDADFSGWLVLLQLIPYVGGLVILFFTVQRSNPAGARHDRRPATFPPYG